MPVPIRTWHATALYWPSGILSGANVNHRRSALPPRRSKPSKSRYANCNNDAWVICIFFLFFFFFSFPFYLDYYYYLFQLVSYLDCSSNLSGLHARTYVNLDWLTIELSMTHLFITITFLHSIKKKKKSSQSLYIEQIVCIVFHFALLPETARQRFLKIFQA